ncbi:MAG: trypsin-like peptidase domain-containing protein [Thermoleophilaceae bacterium]
MCRARGAAALSCCLLAGCGLARDSTSRSASTAPPQSPPAKTIEQTRVEVVQGLGRRGGFDPAGIYKLLSPGVVTVIATSGSGNQAALGSGFVLDSSGYIATNAHVIRTDPPKLTRANQVYVEFADGNRVAARIVGDDLNSDVALLKVEPAGLSLTPLRLGSSAHLTVGAPVAAIGSPFGERQSLSVGVISATGRDIQSLTAFRIPNAIQTDAAINHGNSGGPLIDGRGEVVGINSQIQSSSGGGEGVGFAVPADTVRRSLDALRRFGRVRYAYLGISSEQIYPQLSRRLGLAALRGGLVTKVESGSPAARAGIIAGSAKIEFEGQKDIPQGGDAITAVDGRPVVHSADLTSAIGLKSPGERTVLSVVRGSSRRSVTVTLGARPDRLNPSGG